jgi:nucleoside phosphorylase
MTKVIRTVKPTRPVVRVPVLILSVIIEPEHKAITELLPKAGATLLTQTEADKGLEINRWSIEGESAPIVVATGYINGMGNARSAMETLIFLQRTSPKFVFLCGISGTLDPAKAGLGDVVIGKSVQWWNLNKVTKDATKPAADGPTKYLQIGDHFFRKEISTVGKHNNYWNKRLTEFGEEHETLLRSNTDPALLKRRSALQKERGRQNVLHYEKIVSWEYVLSDKTIRDKIRKDSEGGLVIEMEGAGFASSITRLNEEVNVLQERTNTQIPGDTVGFVFRGVSDNCHDKGHEPQEWRTIAMYNAANALVDFLGTFSEADFLK